MVSLNDEELTSTVVELYRPEWLDDSFTDTELLSIANLVGFMEFLNNEQLCNNLNSNLEKRIDMMLDILFMYRRTNEGLKPQRKIAKGMLVKLKPYLESKEHDMEDNLTGSIKEICSILNRIYFVC